MILPEDHPNRPSRAEAERAEAERRPTRPMSDAEAKRWADTDPWNPANQHPLDFGYVSEDND